MISSDATDIACNALISVPKTRTATPKPPLQPGSALDQGLSQSVPSMCPPSRAAIPLDAVVTNTSVLSGQLALLRPGKSTQVTGECYSQSLIYCLHNLVKT